MIHKNETFALTGDYRHYKKKSLPPYYGTMTTRTLGQLRGELRGRLHRWDAYNLTLDNWMVLICIDMLFFFRLGYPSHILKSMWASCFPPGPRLDLVKACLALVTRTSKHLIPSPQHLSAQLNQDCTGISALVPSPTSRRPSTTMYGDGRPQEEGNYGSSRKGGDGGKGFGRGPKAPRYRGPYDGGYSQPVAQQGDDFGNPLGQMKGSVDPNTVLDAESNLGDTLTQQQQQQQSEAAPQPSAPAPPAREMAEAVVSVLTSREKDQQNSHPGEDSRVRATVDRLSTLVHGSSSGGSGNQDSLEQALERSGVVQRLQADLQGVSQTVETLGRKVGELQRTTEGTADDVKAIRALLAGRPDPPRGDLPPTKGGGRGRGAGIPGTPIGGTVKATLGETPVAQTLVDYETHLDLLGTLLLLGSLDANRGDMQNLAATLQEPAGPQITYDEWWSHVEDCRSLAQWKDKLTTLGAPPEVINTIGTLTDVGELIYSHLAMDGSWHTDVMQTLSWNLG